MAKGDTLAAGGISATFLPPKGISDEKWAQAFDDFDAVRFLSKKTRHEDKPCIIDLTNVPRCVK